jgi:hypothetical protein
MAGDKTGVKGITPVSRFLLVQLVMIEYFILQLF